MADPFLLEEPEKDTIESLRQLHLQRMLVQRVQEREAVVGRQLSIEDLKILDRNIDETLMPPPKATRLEIKASIAETRGGMR